MKPRLVFLHGLFCSPSVWDEHAPAFADWAELETPALPLHAGGVSDAAPSVKGLAEGIARSLAGKDAPPIVIGHSLGGMVGLQLALDWPDTLRSLVLVDAVPSLAAGAELIAEMYAPRTPKALIQRVAQMFVNGQMRIPEDIRAALIESILAFDARGRLAEIRVPVLGIYGGRGRFAEADTARLACDLGLDKIPQFEARIIPGAGHFVHWEAPEAFINYVTQFVKRLESQHVTERICAR